MASVDYVNIEDNELVEGAPVSSNLAFRLRDNPIAAAERADSDFPYNTVGEMVKFSSSTTWTVPAGITKIKVWLSGGGGGAGGGDSGSSGAGFNGLASEVDSISFSPVAAEGGMGGAARDMSAKSPGITDLYDGQLLGAVGGPSGNSLPTGDTCGHPAVMKVFVLDVTPGLVIIITVGLGGAPASTSHGRRGAHGFCYIEY